MVSGPGLRLGFAGTPEFAARILTALLDAGRHPVGAVITQPDRPAGRGRRLRHSPVKELALARGLPLLQPQSAAELKELPLNEFDVLAVAAFGLILPPAVLQAPRLGCINVHASLLPRWRGAAPIQRALLAGDTETGITIMQMDAGLDTGAILDAQACSISEADTAGTLETRLAEMGGPCLLRVLDRLVDGQIARRAQDPTGATYAAKIRKEESRIDWSRTAVEISRLVRAFNPAPLAATVLRGEELRILEAVAVAEAAGRAPGEVTHCTTQAIRVATGSGSLEIRRLQLPGRRPVSARDFLNAHPEWRRIPA